MRLALLAALLLVACGPNVVGDEGITEPQEFERMEQPADGGPGSADGGISRVDGGSADGGVADGGPLVGGERTTYPSGRSGFALGDVLPNLPFLGHVTAVGGVAVRTASTRSTFDLAAIRQLANPAAGGAPFRFLLFNVSAGWCPVCNTEGRALGLGGADAAKPAAWARKGGLFVTVLAQGHGSFGSPATTSDLEAWLNTHRPQSTTGVDLDGRLAAAGLSGAFPVQFVVDLSTMKVLASYTHSSSYEPFERILDTP